MNAKWYGAAARPTASSSSNRPDRWRRRLRGGLDLERGADFARFLQRTANERILGIAVERQQSRAVHAIDLIAVAHLVGLVAKHPGATRTADPHLVIDHHETPCERPASWQAALAEP